MFRQFVFIASWIIVFSIVDAKRISQIKCEEYINGTKLTIPAIPLLPNPTPREIHVFNCPKSTDLLTVVDGEIVKKGEFRHHVLLVWETEEPDVYSFNCGGALISDLYVLTAAHCTSIGAGRRASPKFVRFAELDLNVESEEFDINIDSITRHPQYRFGRIYHDIALVRLAERVRFSRLVRPACLWDGVGMNFSSVIATGFGKINFDVTRNSDTLRKVQLDIMEPSVCSEHFSNTRSFNRGMTDQLLCIGSFLGGRDTCQGDSGGPVQVLLNTKGCIFHVVGITSAGMACGLGQSPALYTKVSSYIDWIEGIVWG